MLKEPGLKKPGTLHFAVHICGFFKSRFVSMNPQCFEADPQQPPNYKCLILSLDQGVKYRQATVASPPKEMG